MRAVRNTSEGVRVVELPEPAGDGERVSIVAAGICGSDLSMISMGMPACTIGHEMAGVLEDGTPVAVEPIFACRTCDQCVQGAYNRCRLGQRIYAGAGQDGGMAEAMIAPREALVPLPAGLPVSDGSLVEPLAVVLHGLRIAGLRGGERVAVVGAGNIGLLAVVAARAASCEVGLVARHAAQIEAGERLGATQASGEYALVVDAAGSESGLARACELAAPGATLSLLGVYWGKVPLPGVQAITKELRVIPSLAYGRHAAGREFEGAAALLAADPQIAQTIITHRFPLEEAPEAFRVAADRASGAIKVVLEP